MRHTIVSLAVLKVTYEELGKDILDVFLPFILQLIADRGYPTIDRTEVDALAEAFFERYGLRVPRLSVQAMLTRAVKRGYIHKKQHRYMPQRGRIKKVNFTENSNRQQSRIDSLLDRLIEYAKSEFDQDITTDEAERALVQYLADQDLEIVVSATRLSILPKLKKSKSCKYIAGRFIQWCYENEYSLFVAIADIAVGHMLASTILYDEFQRFVGKFKKSTVYLDAPLLLHLLGADGPEHQVATRELVEVLRRQGAKIVYFDANLDEALAILRICQDRVDRLHQDRNAGTAIKYFRRSGKTRIDIERIINNAETTLTSEGVLLGNTPDPVTHKAYQVNQEVLERTIIETYWGIGAEASDDQVNRIQRDARSLSYIYKLRLDKEPRSLPDSRHLFVTENPSLVVADRKFARNALHYRFGISAAQTDVLVCTVAWLQSPQNAQALNSKRLIADVHAAISPDATLVEKYVTAVENLRKEDRITENEAIVLRGSMIATDMLQASTFNDPDRFVPQMAEEILEAIKMEERLKGEEVLDEERRNHEETRTSLVLERAEKENALGRIARIETRIRQLTSLVSQILGWLIIGIALALYLLGVYHSRTDAESSILDFLLIGVRQGLGLLGVIFGVTVLKFHKKLSGWLAGCLESLIIPFS